MPNQADTRTIVIVGGVAGGASAATRARRCNEHARIILFEKDEHVSFANCGMPYFIGGEIRDRDKLLVATPELLRRRFKIDVRTGHEVTAIDRQRRVVRFRRGGSEESLEQPYDRLILATGAAPIRPPIAGLDASNVFTLRNLADMDRIREAARALAAPGGAGRAERRAVVVGAGFIGLEMVEQLARLGIRTSLVELMPQVLPPLDPEMAHIIEAELKRHDVDLHLGDGIEGLRLAPAGSSGSMGRSLATGVTLSSGATIDADMVILGIGVRPNTELASAAGLALGKMGGITIDQHGRTSDPNVYAVGDAVEYIHGITGTPMRIALAGPANRAGRIAGQHAATDAALGMSPVVGTAIVRVFDQTAAATGLSVKLAPRLNQTARSVVVSAGHHAGYFPGAEPMFLKLIYEPDSGRVLGAQAVGGAGVDKRIDVIATAMHFRATVRDLAGLDLAYAPPYGSAKDPVHMAAFTACNELDGLASFVQPDAELEGLQVVDVRTDAEVERNPLPGALHVPIDDLRERIGEIDAAKPTVTVCHSGLRAYNAARILMQHGVRDVRVMTGSMSMRRHALRGEG